MTAEQWTAERISHGRELLNLDDDEPYDVNRIVEEFEDALDTIDAQQRELQAARRLIAAYDQAKIDFRYVTDEAEWEAAVTEYVAQRIEDGQS